MATHDRALADAQVRQHLAENDRRWRMLQDAREKMEEAHAEIEAARSVADRALSDSYHCDDLPALEKRLQSARLAHERLFVLIEIWRPLAVDFYVKRARWCDDLRVVDLIEIGGEGDE